MRWTERRQRLRDLLASDQCYHPGSVFDPVSARMAESLEFELGMFAGSVASLTVLGDPDLILLTLSEFADQAYRINRACEMPLLVDADHGYGNALNVRRTVEELENAGVSALSVEDTVLPISHGDGGKTALVSIDEGIGKMRAAVDARRDPSLMIVARTSAVTVNGVDDAIARVRAYQDSGVDAIFLIGIKRPDQLQPISDICTLPLILGGTGPDFQDRDYLASMGVRVCLQGHQPIMAGFRAVYETPAALRNGIRPGDLDGLPDKQIIDRMTRVEIFKALREDFL